MYIFLFILLFCTTAWADHSTLRNDTINTLPDSNLSSFRSNSQIMWDHELADIHYSSFFIPFIKSGGVHPTSLSLTSSAFATEAYVPERINQTSTPIVYAAAATDVCYTIISADNNGIAGWTRVGSTAYYYRCTGGAAHAEPSLPVHSAFLMRLTITANAITAVRSLHNLNPFGDRQINAVRDCGVSPTSDFYTTSVWVSQSAALQACIDRAVFYNDNPSGPNFPNTQSTRAVIYLPTGQYYLATQVILPYGVDLIGDGQFKSVLFTDGFFNSSTGLVRMNGGVFGGPSRVEGFSVICFESCPLTGTGIYNGLNASKVKNVWVSGFAIGVHLDSTDQELSSSIIELNITGLMVSQRHIFISDVSLYRNVTGFAYGESFAIASVSASDKGNTHLVNVKSVQDTDVGFTLVDGQHVTMTNCSVFVHDSTTAYVTAGLLIGTGAMQDVTVNGFQAHTTTGASTATGIKLLTGARHVTITGSQVSGWRYGIWATGVNEVILSHNQVHANLIHGLRINGGDGIVLADNMAWTNGGAGVTDAGIYVDNSSNGTITLTGNLGIDSGAGPQEYGFHLKNTTIGIIITTGNYAYGNSITQVFVDGTTAQNTGVRTRSNDSPLWKELVCSDTLNFGTVNANTTKDLTLPTACAGVVAANLDRCVLGITHATMTTGLLYQCWISADDVVSVRAANVTTGNIVTTAGIFAVTVFKVAR